MTDRMVFLLAVYFCTAGAYKLLRKWIYVALSKAQQALRQYSDEWNEKKTVGLILRGGEKSLGSKMLLHTRTRTSRLPAGRATVRRVRNDDRAYLWDTRERDFSAASHVCLLRVKIRLQSSTTLLSKRHSPTTKVDGPAFKYVPQEYYCLEHRTDCSGIDLPTRKNTRSKKTLSAREKCRKSINPRLFSSGLQGMKWFIFEKKNV